MIYLKTTNCWVFFMYLLSHNIWAHYTVIIYSDSDHWDRPEADGQEECLEINSNIETTRRSKKAEK